MTSIPISDAEFNEQITPFEVKQLHSRDWMQRAARQYYSIDQSNYVYNHGEPRTSVNNLKFWIPVIVEMEASEPFITTKGLFASFFGIIKSEKHEAPTVVIPQHLYTLSLTTSDDTTLSAFKLQLAKFLETSSSELETRSRKYWEHEQKERPSAIAGDGLPRIEGEKDPATDVTETSPVSRLEPEASRRDVNARSLDVMKDSTLVSSGFVRTYTILILHSHSPDRPHTSSKIWDRMATWVLLSIISHLTIHFLQDRMTSSHPSIIYKTSR